MNLPKLLKKIILKEPQNNNYNNENNNNNNNKTLEEVIIIDEHNADQFIKPLAKNDNNNNKNRTITYEDYIKEQIKKNNPNKIYKEFKENFSTFKQETYKTYLNLNNNEKKQMENIISIIIETDPSFLKNNKDILNKYKKISPHQNFKNKIQNKLKILKDEENLENAIEQLYINPDKTLEEYNPFGRELFIQEAIKKYPEKTITLYYKFNKYNKNTKDILGREKIRSAIIREYKGHKFKENLDTIVEIYNNSKNTIKTDSKIDYINEIKKRITYNLEIKNEYVDEFIETYIQNIKEEPIYKTKIIKTYKNTPSKAKSILEDKRKLKKEQGIYVGY